MEVSPAAVGSYVAGAVDGYLTRLGLERPASPDVAWLRDAHRAHVERIPFENLDDLLGRQPHPDPFASMIKFARGRGGRCFELNSAFAALLATLGYDVATHLGDVRGIIADRENEPIPRRDFPHPMLTVRCEGERWLVDVGMGDALYEPIPLRAGTYQQGAFTFELEPWPVREQAQGGWRFVHAPEAFSFASMVFTLEPVDSTELVKAERRAAEIDPAQFTTAALISHRVSGGSHFMHNHTLIAVDSTGETEQFAQGSEQWFALLADIFGLHLHDMQANVRARLWRHVRTQHELWLAKRAAAIPE